MKTFFIFFSTCTFSAFAFTPWLNENSTDLGISEGDIAHEDAPASNEQMTETEDHQGHRTPSETIKKWEKKIVPYNIHSTFDKKQRAIILDAMMEVEDNTCIFFVPRKLQQDYILFKKLDHGSICSSIVGRLENGGRQHVNLTDECVERNTVLHILMHILGFHHEHSRHDRDKHIQIDLNHVRTKYKQILKFIRKVDPLDLHLPYDYKSITHYPVDAYSIYTDGITIRSKIPWFQIKADGLSDIDIWKIKHMYNCLDSDEDVKSSNNIHEDVKTTNLSNIETATVDQQRHQDETNTSQRTTSQLPTIQSIIKQVQTISSTTITETSIGTTVKMTTSNTTRLISILNKEIIKAVEVGNEAKVKQLLNEGADVNARTGEYRNKTLLHIASEKGHENVVSLLLVHGANVNNTDKPFGDAPIHKAAESGYANVVSLLFSYNVSLEMKGTYGKTPLHYAARYGHVNVASLSLDKGANIEAKDIDAWTPLHYAVRYGHVNVVSFLLDQGANIEARSRINWTPLHHAAWNGHVNVVSLLLDKGANIEARGTSNLTSLHIAAWNGNVNVLSLLLDKGANIFAKGHLFNQDETPLDLAKQRSNKPEIVKILERKPISVLNKEIIDAVEVGNEDKVRTLLNEGADVNAKDNMDLTPLLHAASKGHVNVVSLLLDKGANTESKDTSNLTPLHYAASKGHLNVVSLLLDKGANIEAKNRWDWTPLHSAVISGRVNVVSLLLDKGANIFAIGSSFFVPSTPLGMAERYMKTEIVEILERKQRQLTG